MKKIKTKLLFQLLIAITTLFAGCKKNTLDNPANNESHFKTDEASIAERKAKIQRAKQFYEGVVGTKARTETTDDVGVVVWELAGIGFIPQKNVECVIIPEKFAQQTYFSIANTNTKIDRESATNIWMYEKSPGVFTIEQVTALTAKNPTSNRESYLIKNLLDGTEKVEMQENGTVYEGSLSRSEDGPITTTWVHCDIFNQYSVTNDQFGNVLSQIYIKTYSVCEVVAVFTSDPNDPSGGTGGGGGGFEPKDDDNMDYSRPYDWLVDFGGVNYGNGVVTWEVTSYEELTAKRQKAVAGGITNYWWEFTNAVHKKSDIQITSNDFNQNPSYVETTNTISLNGVDYVDTRTKGKIEIYRPGNLINKYPDRAITITKSMAGFN